MKNRSARIGESARREGQAFEGQVLKHVSQIDGWSSRPGGSDDYSARKADIFAKCPAGIETAVQVSLGAKSKRERKSLENRNTVPVSQSDVLKSRVGSLICTLCPLNAECSVKEL
jgi:hypothetical protein